MDTYIGRLRVSNSDLNSPDQKVVQMAYDVLCELFLEFSSDSHFLHDIRQVYREHPELFQELKIRLKNGTLSEDERTTVLKHLESAFSQYQPPMEKPDSISLKVINVNSANEDANGKEKPHTKTSREFLRSNVDLNLISVKFAIPEPVAWLVATLISLAVLIGGISAGYDLSSGMILALILLTIAVLIFIYNVLSIKK